MSQWWQVLSSVIGGLILLWLLLVAVLWLEQRRHPDRASLRDLVRLAPDVIRLVKRLAGDPAVSIGVRIWLIVLVVYLLSPIDLIPDFIPVLGLVDDALIVAMALRFATRRAGSDAIQRHWPGTDEGFGRSASLGRSGFPVGPWQDCPSTHARAEQQAEQLGDGCGAVADRELVKSARL